MDLKIKKAKELLGARDSMDAPHANIEWFYYRGLDYYLWDLNKERLLFLINELNQENIALEKRVNDLETSISDIKEVLQEYKDYFCELQVI